MTEYLFLGLDGGPRLEKPRTRELTMVANFGMSPAQVRDLLEIGAPYFDFLKIAVGLSRLFPKDVLIDVIGTCRERGVECFPGGMYLEYAEVNGKTELYFPACIEAGYKWIEVSDNLADMSVDWKQRMIRRATQEFGLSVLGEVGKKAGLQATTPLADDAKACLDAGASLILVEAAEMVSDDTATARMIEEVVQAVGLDKVMFELPGPWIGIGHGQAFVLQSRLMDRFGLHLNIGNVVPEDLMKLEAYRRVLGVNAGKLID